MSIFQNISGSLLPIAGFQVADATLDITSEQPIQNAAVANAVNAVNEYGCKNLLPNEAVAKAEDGITWTVNSDGTVIANGTASSNTRLTLNYGVDGSGWSNKILSGSVGGTDDTYYIVIQQTASPYNTYARCTSEEVVISEIPGNVQCFIYIKSGTVCNNLTFRPMIRDARFTNADYVPFAKSNRQLTQATTVIDYSSQLTSIPTGVTVKAYKYGRIVEVIASAGTVSVAANSAQKIASYPAELTPIDIGITEPSGTNNPDTHYVLKALNDGYYLKNNSSSAQTYIQGRMIYISAS